MNDAVTTQLLNELSLLRKKLEETDIFKDIQALERVIRLRGGNIPPETQVSKSVTKVVPSAVPLQEISTTAAMKDAVRDFLSDKNSPVSTKEIYDSISQMGVYVPGENPTNNLSAHLSRDPRFLSWGREGWTLASLISPLGTEIDEIARDFVGSMGADTKEELRASLQESSDIPQEIDREMLRYARNFVGRHLTETEKRDLRAKILAAMNPNFLDL
jgi:hypothetical protein